jgi:hypothetical protein
VNRTFLLPFYDGAFSSFSESRAKKRRRRRKEARMTSNFGDQVLSSSLQQALLIWNLA